MKKQSPDAAEVEPFVLDPSAASQGVVRPQNDTGTARLSQLIFETLADFDPDVPSTTRIKVASPPPQVSLPKAWAKKAM